jgi:glycosyltransferase involved in cell wall biosynthesis
MTPALPSVSIVIPAYNEEETIRACVLAAIHQTVAASEIIVVDNRSTDDTRDIVARLQAEYPDAPIISFSQDAEQGLIPTRNFGLDRAQGDVIGRIDADSVLEPDWVAQVQRAFADPASPRRRAPSSTTTCRCGDSGSRLTMPFDG